jgi:hypothetical protein
MPLVCVLKKINRPNRQYLDKKDDALTEKARQQYDASHIRAHLPQEIPGKSNGMQFAIWKAEWSGW